MNSQITWSLPGTPSVTLARMAKPSARKIAMASRVDGHDVEVDGQAEEVDRRVDPDLDLLGREQHPHRSPPWPATTRITLMTKTIW